MGIFGTILVKLAISVLGFYYARADYKAMVIGEIENAGLQRLAEASKWMLDSGDDGAALRVRQPAGGVETGPSKPSRVPKL